MPTINQLYQPLRYLTSQKLHIITRTFSLLRYPVVIFLIIGGLFGTLFVFSVPPFLQPDEAAHFNRVYQISGGGILGQKVAAGYGGYLPKTVIDFENTDDNLINYPASTRTSFHTIIGRIISPGLTINKGPRYPLEFSNTVEYNPILYAPQTLGMLVSKILNLSVPITFYLVRLIGFISWLLICGYGIKKMRNFGWAAVVLLLTPLCLQIVAAVSADSLTIAFSVLFIGLIVEALSSEKLDTRRMVLLFAATMLLACVKVPYELLALLIVLLPTKNFRDIKQRIYFTLAILGALLLITGIWTLIAQQEYVSYRTVTTGVRLTQKTQELYLLHHPLSFAHKLYDTYIRSNPYSFDPLWGYVGVLGTIGYTIPNWAVCLYFSLLGIVLAALRSGATKKDYLTLTSRWFTLGVTVCLFVALNAVVFITWSRIKIPIIEGIQSRYFIPMTPLLILLVLPIRKRASNLSRSFYILVPLSLIAIQIATMLAVYYQFYAAPMPVIGN